MKKFLFVLAIIIVSVFLWNLAKPQEVQKTIKAIGETVASKPVTPQTISKNYVFVPYWTFTKSINEEDDASLLYFGLGVNENGIDLNDEGYKKLDDFVRLSPNNDERILVVRMVDKNLNAKILKDQKLQDSIATSASKLALDNDFNGVMLDYETSAFGFESTTKNITSFYKIFSGKVKQNNLLFYTALYGDTYFRARPYDVAKIGEMSDKIVVMTYDFSKSRGNPGPNFPLYDNNIYGYDLGQMVEDFQKDVDNQKLVIAFGYFGYDWEVNNDGTSISNGVPMSTNEIESEFVDDCEYEKCTLKRDSESQEPSILYVDDEDTNHVIWFEDEISAEKKKDFLKSKGILETGAWAYSYY